MRACVTIALKKSIKDSSFLNLPRRFAQAVMHLLENVTGSDVLRATRPPIKFLKLIPFKSVFTSHPIISH
jgi:hypothetical protein